MSNTSTRAGLLRESVAPYSTSEPAATAHTKLSISLPSDLLEVVRAAAAESGLSVSATIAAALRRTLDDAEQARLDAALLLDADENREWATASAEAHARLVAELQPAGRAWTGTGS
jgi:hypothetical protein